MLRIITAKKEKKNIQSEFAEFLIEYAVEMCLTFAINMCCGQHQKFKGLSLQCNND